MAFSFELGLTKILFEGDSQILVWATNCKDELCTDYGSDIMDTWKLLSVNQHWNLVFTYKEANRDATMLANLVFSFPIEIIWI